jgi:hypothetical protein
MISRKTGWVIVGSALLLAACHKADTTADTDDASNAAVTEDLGNVSDAANGTDEMDNGDRYNPDTRGKPASGTQ